jgi:carboxyl-terminal processing protease
VDGQPTERQTVDEVIKRVRGDAGTSVTLGITHRDGSTTEVPIVRAEIVIPPVSWAFVPGTKIADIRLAQFSQGAADGVRSALTEALAGGAEGAVLDLRGNPGGLVDQAVGIASMFLPEGATVYGQQDRSGSKTEIPATGSPLAPDLPLVVLTDFGSASSSEIVAAALQDNERAQVVGLRTFGTGTVLNMFPLSDGSAIMLGVIEWLTPKGAGIFDVGITPDVEVELPTNGTPTDPSDLEDLTRKEFRQGHDTQLQRAVKLLTSPAASSGPGTPP